MIKYILRLSIAAFIIIFTYDTINFYLTRSKVPQENQLVVVRPEIKPVDEVRLDEPNLTEYYEKPLYYGGLGAAAATGFGIFCYCLSAVCSKSKLRVSKDTIKSEGGSTGKAEGELPEDVRSRRSANESSKSNSGSGKGVKGSSSQASALNSMLDSADDSQNFTDILLGRSQEEVSESVSATTVDTKQTTSGMVAEPIIGNIIQCKSDGTTLRNSSIKENASGHIESRKLYEDSDVILGSRIILGSEISYKSKNSSPKDITVLPISEQVIAAMACLQPMNQVEMGSSSFTKEDRDKLELRLSNIENKLIQIEKASKESAKRVEVTECELIDLQEQMYTVLTKLDEEQKPNYIIVSQMSMVDETKENAINEMITSQTGSRTIENQHEQESIVSKMKSKGKENAKLQSSKGTPQNREKLELLRDSSHLKTPMSNDRPLSSGSSQQKSVGLEAILLKEITPKSKTAPPKNANPKVPTHILQPYKRSSFTSTDSMSDINRVKQRLMKARNERFM